jgi:tripartite-type tricarboxylate transporter receptor subunit TctC
MASWRPRRLAQDYPARPVRIIVPFAPGGSADVFGRFIAQRLQDRAGPELRRRQPARGRLA